MRSPLNTPPLHTHTEKRNKFFFSFQKQLSAQQKTLRRKICVSFHAIHGGINAPSSSSASTEYNNDGMMAFRQVPQLHLSRPLPFQKLDAPLVMPEHLSPLPLHHPIHDPLLTLHSTCIKIIRKCRNMLLCDKRCMSSMSALA